MLERDIINTVRAKLAEETEAWLREHAEHLADVEREPVTYEMVITDNGAANCVLAALRCRRCEDGFSFTVTSGPKRA